MKNLKQDFKDTFTKENFKEAFNETGTKIVGGIIAVCMTASAAGHLYEYEEGQYKNWEARQALTEQATSTKAPQDTLMLNLD